jgi:hypothetical protein
MSNRFEKERDMLRRLLVLTIACWGAAPAHALAAGGPVPPVQGGTGISLPGLPSSFVARDAGRDTRIDRVSATSGEVQASRTVRGHVGIPGAAFDGSLTGLSADGRTLVVAGDPGKAGTRLAVLDARRLRAPAREIRLRGYYTVDAISPDGGTIYLTHYLSPDRDVLRYEVRAYDVAQGRIAGGPIVDPREPDEKMQGAAMTRIMSPDGRWAYTLYGGPESFVHALDTVGRKAFCIDLDDISGDLASAPLRLDGGGGLHVGDFATIDTRTFEVSEGDAPAAAPPAATPRAAATAAPPAGGRTGDNGAFLWTALVIVPLAAAALALEARRRRRARVKTAA